MSFALSKIQIKPMMKYNFTFTRITMFKTLVGLFHGATAMENILLVHQKANHSNIIRSRNPISFFFFNNFLLPRIFFSQCYILSVLFVFVFFFHNYKFKLREACLCLEKQNNKAFISFATWSHLKRQVGYLVRVRFIPRMVQVQVWWY